MVRAISKCSRSSRGSTTVSFSMSVYVCVSVSIQVIIIFSCLFLSGGSSVWESVSSGHAAVDPSLLSDAGALETSVWPSVQPHHLWDAQSTTRRSVTSCAFSNMNSLFIFWCTNVHAIVLTGFRSFRTKLRRWVLRMWLFLDGSWVAPSSPPSLTCTSKTARL